MKLKKKLPIIDIAIIDGNNSSINKRDAAAIIIPRIIIVFNIAKLFILFIPPIVITLILLK